MPDSIEASEKLVDNWTKQVQERAERYQAMAGRVEEMTITERSKDNAVEVTISARGLLNDLKIAESASGKRMAEVSALVMATVQRAQSRIPELLQQAMAETIGTQDETANKLFDDAKKQFPDPPPEEEPSAPEPQRELRFGPEDEEPPPPPPPPPPPMAAPRTPPPPGPPKSAAPPPRRRPAPDDDEDEDFGGRILS